MLNKLRAKFVLIAMSLVTLVLLCVFAAVVVTTARQQERESLAAMENALQWHSYRPSILEFKLQSERKYVGRDLIIPAFCVTVSQSGKVLFVASGSDVSVSSKVLNQAVSLALESGSVVGTLPELGLRYLIGEHSGSSMRIVFCDQQWEHAALLRLSLTFFLVGLCALVPLFFISIFLSRLAMRPVERAWAQQQQFVADASHELKTPLTVILANTGIVLARPTETVASQKKWLTYIQEEASHMKDLVEDLLFLAKHDDPKRTSNLVLVNLSDVVTGCLLRFETVAFEQHVKLESQIQPDLLLLGDPSGLDRLSGILLDNAIKYAGSGGQVSLSLQKSQDKLVLRVHNTGAPIAPEHLSHIFERFYRAESSRSRQFGGYGLGLAIARSIVLAHGGHLSATSTAEQGTFFTAAFPFK